MYGKLFESIYDGTLVDDWEALITFQQMIILCDSEGMLDMTASAMARRTGIPIKHIKHGIVVLESPDPESRTPKNKGRRIVRLSDHRDWGWLIVNHKHYRDLRTASDRREYMRNYMRDKRNKDKLTNANESSQLTKLANTDAYINTNTEAKADADSKQKTTSLNSMSSKLDVSSEILNYLNQKTGKSFKHVDSNLKLIRARLKEGHLAEQIISVIDMKYEEWVNDDKLARYLRPATLFNAEKFNQYVGEIGIETPEQRKLRELNDWANGND